MSKNLGQETRGNRLLRNTLKNDENNEGGWKEKTIK